MASKHPLWARGMAYARAVAAGRRSVCRTAVQTCQRHIDDLKRAKFPYHFDPARAERVLAWLEQMPHIKGKEARRRELLRLQPWQCFVIGCMMGWIDADGMRRFRISYIEVPRKNGKSMKLSGLNLYALLADDEPGADVFSAGVDRNQARVVYDVSKAMVEKLPALRERYELETVGGLSQVGTIHAPMTHSRYTALSRESGGNLDGLNIHFASCDELHAWKSRQMYDVLLSGTGSRDQPMICTITTAGHNQASVCYEQSQYAKRLLAGRERHDQFFAAIYCADEDDPWDAERTWKRCNPNLGVSKTMASLRAEARIAKSNPSAQAEFKRKHLCRWTASAAAWISPESVAACKTKLKWQDFAGEECWIGIDLASKRDLCAVVYLWHRDGVYYCKPSFHLPEGTVGVGANAPVYQGWRDAGWLTVHDGNRIDFGRIEDEVVERGELYDLLKVGADPHHAAYMLTNLEARLPQDVEIVETLTTPISLTFGAKELDGLVSDSKFRFDGNPILSWCIDNTVIRLDDKGNWFPTREDRSQVDKKIDGSIALINSVTMCLSSQHGAEQPAVYKIDWEKV